MNKNKTNIRFSAILLLAILLASSGSLSAQLAVSNAKTRTGSITYVVAPLAKYDVDIFSKEAEEPGDFAGVEQRCAAAKHPMVFAMNGGKCKSLKPMGLLIKGMNKYKDFVWPDDKVFFAIGPSAIFARARDNGPYSIIAANKFKVNDDLAAYQLAVQSGAILLSKGFMNPVIVRATGSQVCNGIGIRSNGDFVLAISDTKITLRELALFFQEQNCSDAMLLDEGSACQWYTPGTPKKPGTFGEILVITKK